MGLFSVVAGIILELSRGHLSLYARLEGPSLNMRTNEKKSGLFH